MIRYAGLRSSRGPSQCQGSRDVPWCAAETFKLHGDAKWFFHCCESPWTQEVRTYVLDEEKTELSKKKLRIIQEEPDSPPMLSDTYLL